MYLPWSSIGSFRCLACGTCCSHFMVPLRASEALSIARIFGWDHLEVRKGRLFIRKHGRACPFLVRRGSLRVCLLQEVGIKPRACKVWPFHIFRTPEYGKREEASLSTRYGTFYVYVDPRCPGISLGRPTDTLLDAVVEALEIWLGVRTEQCLTTSPLGFLGRNGHERAIPSLVRLAESEPHVFRIHGMMR